MLSAKKAVKKERPQKKLITEALKFKEKKRLNDNKEYSKLIFNFDNIFSNVNDENQESNTICTE